MKTVIALRGIGNTGKSSTLRKVYELLIRRYALQTHHVNLTVEGALNKSNTNVIVSINGVKVGIMSLGDVPGILARNLRECEFKGCAIIVCASRTAGSFETLVNDLKRSSYEIEWVDKRKEGDTKTERDAANLRVAEEILTKIEELL